MKKFLVFLCSVTFVFGIVGTASALDFSFTGDFDDDDDVQLFNFSVGALSNVTLRTLSYAGGTNAAGDVIPPGGFDPILALFDSFGNFIDNNDDGSFPDVGVDPVTGFEYDTYLESSLSAGDYQVAVSQYYNWFSGGVGDNISVGFDEQGRPEFTGVDFGPGFGKFYDDGGYQRTSYWAFDVLNVAEAEGGPGPIPEPTTMLLLGSGLIGLAGFGRKKFFKK